MNPAIEINGLIKRYGTKTALHDLTLKIGAQKIIGLIGRNGAGKTTFLKICAGLLRPTAGELRVWGERPFDNMKALSQLVYIGEDTNYDEDLKLIDLFELGLIYYSGWDRTLAEKLLKRFQLGSNLKYKSLSLGMKTQFKLIMGLSSRVPLVLFDGPTLGMDMAVRKEFYHVLISDYSGYPRTFILSSHLPDEVENLIEELRAFKGFWRQTGYQFHRKLIIFIVIAISFMLFNAIYILLKEKSDALLVGSGFFSNRFSDCRGYFMD